MLVWTVVWLVLLEMSSDTNVMKQMCVSNYDRPDVPSSEMLTPSGLKGYVDSFCQTFYIKHK